MTGLGITFAARCFATTDGDTIKVRTHDDRDPIGVRLWGINSVERGQPGYRDARLALQTLALGKRLLCEAMGFSGDRVVARCRRDDDGLDLGEAQVRAGQASDCPRYSGGLYAIHEQPNRPPRAAFCEVTP